MLSVYLANAVVVDRLGPWVNALYDVGIAIAGLMLVSSLLFSIG